MTAAAGRDRFAARHQRHRGPVRRGDGSAPHRRGRALSGAAGRILVDEAQFLSPAQVRQLAHLADELGIPVLCYGLRTDFQGRLFPGSAELLALADSLVEIKSVCECGRKATMNPARRCRGQCRAAGRAAREWAATSAMWRCAAGTSCSVQPDYGIGEGKSAPHGLRKETSHVPQGCSRAGAACAVRHSAAAAQQAGPTPGPKSGEPATIPFLTRNDIRTFESTDDGDGVYIQDVRRNWYYVTFFGRCNELPWAIGDRASRPLPAVSRSIAATRSSPDASGAGSPTSSIAARPREGEEGQGRPDAGSGGRPR